MAWIVGDSFDFYNVAADGVGRWDTAQNFNLNSAITRFSAGQSYQIQSSANVTLQKNAFNQNGGNANESTIWINLSFYLNTPVTGTTQLLAHQLLDAATAQVSLVFRTAGDIVVRTGGTAGTIVGTYSGAFAQGVWNHFQIQVIVHASAGAVHIRKNGNTVDDFAVTGVATATTANNFANQYLAFNPSGSNGNLALMDDLLVFSSTAGAPNTWVGDIKAVQLMPNADTATKNFSPFPATFTFGTTSTASTKSIAANTIVTTALQTANAPGTIGKCTVNFNAGFTGNAKVGIYASDGTAGAPGTLMATSNQVTNPGAGNVDFTFASPPTVVNGVQYYFGILADAAFVTKCATATATIWSESRTYASGFTNPSTAASSTATQPDILATITPANYFEVNELTQDGDATYVFTATNGNIDLYDLQDLATTPANIIGVQTVAFMRKTDAGARNGQIEMKSGATVSLGTDTALPTSYGQQFKVDTVDPNTSSAWTASAVNALQVGPKCSA